MLGLVLMGGALLCKSLTQFSVDGFCVPSLLFTWGQAMVDFLGRSTGVGCHFLLQGIFPAQGLNLGFLHCRQMIYCLSYQGSPKLWWR